MKSITHNNLSLLGDAAHPIVPFIGQGGCLALEDAYIFGSLLIEFDSNIKKTQDAYQSMRMNRIKKITNLSIQQGYLNHIKDPFIIFLRNCVMRYLPSLAMKSIRKKVWNYDLEAEIRDYR